MILAIGAYGLYQGFSPRKGFKAPMKGKNEGEIADTVMRLALYIALINPCMGIPWGKEHTLQGKRGQRRPKSDLEVLLDSLMDRYAQLPVEIEGDDLVEELYGDEVASLKVTIGAVYRDIQLEESERMIQPDAVKAAKAKLMTIGIECKTNVEGQEWAQFVAAAWGVTPSQVVSAAKKIEK